MTITGSQPAYLDALFGIARFGASRFGAFDQNVIIRINGVVIGGARNDAFDPGILIGSLTIQDLLDDRPNTASFSAWNYRPNLGDGISINLGSVNNAPIFAGVIIDVTQGYLTKPKNLVFHCSCIDYTWRLMNAKAFGFYQNVSATTIVLDVLARFAPSVDPKFVEPNLPGIAEMIVTNEDVPAVLKRIANRIGAYFYVDYAAAVHFFLTDTIPNPAPLVASHPSLSAVECSRDLSQVITRALSEGGGGNTIAPLAPSDTRIPIDVASWYTADGGTVTIGPNRVRYTGVAAVAGAGSLVGPGIAPVVPPTLALVNAPGLAAGAYSYAFTFQSAAGETKPSPIATAATGTIPTPTAAPPVGERASGTNFYNPGGYRIGDTVELGYSYSTNASASQALPPGSGPVSPLTSRVATASPNWDSIGGEGNFFAKTLYATVAPSADPNVKQIILWWRVNGGTWYHKNATLPNPNPSGFYEMDTAAGSSVWPGPPPATGPAIGQVQISNVATGPSGVTNRKIYRTAANGSQLKLLTTLAGNASTGPLTDTAADGTLGANAPTSDTSGLSGTAGQVNAGETAIIVAGSGWASPSGGFAIIGNGKQVVRYSGVTATSITGIPATGVGAIVSAVPYNSSITAAPMLTGVPSSGDGAVTWSVAAGERVNVLAIVDDPAAQAAIRAQVNGHSGIIEEFISDGRLSLVEATARGTALLKAKATPLVTLRYSSRDVATRSGATITADLPPPTDIHETLKIQQVTIDRFDVSPATGLAPTYHVTASSERYSLEDLLRQVKT